MKMTVTIPRGAVKFEIRLSSPNDDDKSEYTYGVNNNHSIIYNDQMPPISLL